MKGIEGKGMETEVEGQWMEREKWELEDITGVNKQVYIYLYLYIYIQKINVDKVEFKIIRKPLQSYIYISDSVMNRWT
jgi:hypothetical protein